MMARSSRTRSKISIPEEFIEEAMSEMQLRPAVCVFCGTSMTIKVLDEHYETCDFYPIPCPYNCGQKELPRKQMRTHLNECPLCLLVCEFADVGCQFQGLEDDFQQHKREKMGQHLDLLCESHYNQKTDSDAAMGKLATYLKEKSAANAAAIRNLEKKVTELSQQIQTLKTEIQTSKTLATQKMQESMTSLESTKACTDGMPDSKLKSISKILSEGMKSIEFARESVIDSLENHMKKMLP